ncbi:MAG: type I pullulanase [Oscillospiraceae bacterium]|nr:type I pullulanase [Oscillospiraceae bacterium]
MEAKAYEGALGASYTAEGTDFAVWSPCAEDVTLRLYESGDGECLLSEANMRMDSFGVWRAHVSGDLDGRYYTYLFTHGGAQYEAPDIYSKSAGLNGRRSFIFRDDSAFPDGWEDDRPVKLKAPSDAVIYELHVRDLSMDGHGSFELRGCFGALCEEGTVNSFGDSVGTDYIASLGVTHVHLLPVMENGSTDEAAPEYNWGYDPHLYNVPEGSYSTAPRDGRSRVRELRELVMALHRRGIGVIFDVVYNHTYLTDGSPFEAAYPGYWYRHDGERYSNGSGCGNELATERPMVRRFICDSLCAIARDYHVDGFRFDLMGLIDITTMDLCSRSLKKINKSMLLYGEGWTGGASPLPEKRRALKHHVKRLRHIAVFSDDFRDGVKGSVFDSRDRGYVNGVYSDERRELIKSVMCGGVFHHGIRRSEAQCWAGAPVHCVNYVEAHDNLTLHDKLVCSMPHADDAERLRVGRLAAALVLLSQGIPFIQAGQELLRSKPDGKGGFVQDSYNSPDSINCIKWDDVTAHRSTVEYYRGLIAIRKRFPELRMTTAEEVRHIRFTDLYGGGFVMYAGELVLVVQPCRRKAAVRLSGSFAVLADGDRASPEPLRTVSGRAVCMPQSILLLKKADN